MELSICRLMFIKTMRWRGDSNHVRFVELTCFTHVTVEAERKRAFEMEIKAKSVADKVRI